MKTTENTVLVTGGSAGIGFEIAKLFSQRGNRVIILGRNNERLIKATANLDSVTPINCDISNERDVQNLVDTIKKDFPQLNMVINNAGKAMAYDLVGETVNAVDKATGEILTNYLSVVGLNEKLIPLLRRQPQAAIVNVSSIVAFVPGTAVATYSASKAALHSYTQALRISLERVSNISVFELMPPLVNTEFSAPIGGHKGIAPSLVAEELLKGLENDEYEIRVGDTEKLYRLYLSSPTAALEAMNSIVKIYK